MSCCPPSITPDFSDGGGGNGIPYVQTVGAGTNITISGTPTDPVVNAVAGVSAVEGLIGSINLVGIGCSITTAGTTDINIEVPVPPVAPVSSVAGATGAITMTGTGCTVVGGGSNIAITVPTPPAAPVSSVAGATGAITMTGTGCSVAGAGSAINITVPTPPVSSVAGSTGAITMTGTGCSVVGGGSAIVLTVPPPPFSSVAGATGAITMTGTGCTVSGGASAIGITVPPPPVSNITGSGSAVVSNVGSVYNVAVNIPAGNLPPINTFLTCNAQTAGFGGTLDQLYGSAPVYILMDYPFSSPNNYAGYNYVDIEFNITIMGVGNYFFGQNSCQFGLIGGQAGTNPGTPGTVVSAGYVLGSPSTFTLNLGFYRMPLSQFLLTPPQIQRYLYITNVSTNPAVNFSIIAVSSYHKTTITV